MRPHSPTHIFPYRQSFWDVVDGQGCADEHPKVVARLASESHSDANLDSHELDYVPRIVSKA